MSMPSLKAMLTLPMTIPTAMFILSQPMASSIQPCLTQPVKITTISNIHSQVGWRICWWPC